VKTGILGRADLLEALLTGNQAVCNTVAGQLGLAKETDTKPVQLEPQPQPATTEPDQTLPEIPVQALRPTPFWQAHQFKQRQSTAPEPERIDASAVIWRNRPTQAPRFQLLSHQPVLQPRVYQALDHTHPSRRLDVRAMVRELGQGRCLQRLPYEKQCSWGEQIHIIDDRSDHLIPYWQDHDALLRWLLPMYPVHAVAYARFHAGMREPRLLGAATGAAYRMPSPGTVMLILSDLGTLLKDQGQATQHWLRFGRRLAAAGHRPLVLMPELPPQTNTLTHCFNVLGWQTKRLSRSQPQRRQSCEQLLTLVAPALRIEPGFLRAVRVLSGLDVGVESELWQDAALSSQSSVAATLHPDKAKRWRDAFAKQPQWLQKKVLKCLSAWRAELPAEIWFEEVLCLTEQTQSDCIADEDVQQSRAFFKQLGQQVRHVGGLTPVPGSIAWFCRAEKRFTEAVWEHAMVGDDLKKLSWHLHQDDPEFQLDYALDPALVRDDTLPLQTCYVYQQGAQLLLTASSAPENASPLGRLCYRVPLLHCSTATRTLALPPPGNTLLIPLPSTHQMCLRSDCEQLDCHTIHPVWADAIGRDAIGLWADIQIESETQAPVVQRLRWIPPGLFMMGSPASEPGRWEDEGPQHPAHIQRVFWLFDTPVTQALWQTVMGANPSRFNSPQRPVESVSWDEAQQFLQTINQAYPELQLVLPSETQWEYACRAGTEATTYAGPIEIVGENNAPVLDVIAWYGGNSGLDFELEDGADSADWPEKQHEHQQAGTHPVAKKRANPWGLYDMLGNVWEWCEDGKREYSKMSQNDAVTDTARRVVRGGSWVYGARFVRASCRYWFSPGERFNFLGFRCARVQPEPRQASQHVEAFSASPASGAAGVVVKAGANKEQS